MRLTLKAARRGPSEFGHWRRRRAVSVGLVACLAGACDPDSGWQGAALAGEGARVVHSAPTVVLLSIDGLAPRFVENLMDEGLLPGFARLQAEGAFTHNARTEPRISWTVPNHVSMITGRPALALEGAPGVLPHLVTDNYDPGDGITVHQYNPELGYAQSVFDVVHDLGGYTSLFAGKSKFLLIRRSYAAPAGAVDDIPPDDGRNKIDDFDVMGDALALTKACLQKLRWAAKSGSQSPRFAMLHVADPDVMGHAYGWGSENYRYAVMVADSIVQQVLGAFDDGSIGPGALILTADHGGVDTAHDDPTQPEIGAIPFYVWGEGIPAGDLYELSGATRDDPGIEFQGIDPLSPLRNGDAANLALWLLGLDEIAGSGYRGVRFERWSERANASGSLR